MASTFLSWFRDSGSCDNVAIWTCDLVTKEQSLFFFIHDLMLWQYRNKALFHTNTNIFHLTERWRRKDTGWKRCTFPFNSGYFHFAQSLSLQALGFWMDHLKTRGRGLSPQLVLRFCIIILVLYIECNVCSKMYEKTGEGSELSYLPSFGKKIILCVIIVI